MQSDIAADMALFDGYEYLSNSLFRDKVPEYAVGGMKPEIGAKKHKGA